MGPWTRCGGMIFKGGRDVIEESFDGKAAREDGGAHHVVLVFGIVGLTAEVKFSCEYSNDTED